MTADRNLVLIISGIDVHGDDYSFRARRFADAFKSAGFGCRVVSVQEHVVFTDETADRLALIFSLTPILIDQWLTTSGRHLSAVAPFICHYPNSPFLLEDHIRLAPSDVIFSTSSSEYADQLKLYFGIERVILSYPSFPFARLTESSPEEYRDRDILFLFIGSVTLHGSRPILDEEMLSRHWTETFGRYGAALIECYRHVLGCEFASTVATLDSLVDLRGLRESDPGLVARMLRELDLRIRFAKRRLVLQEVARFPSMIVGAGWREILGGNTVGTVVDDGVTASSMDALYRRSQVAINVAHSTQYSEHERIFAAWHSGSTLLSERSLYLERECRANRDYVPLPLGGAECAATLDRLASDVDTRYRIAEAGWRGTDGRFLPAQAAAYYLRVGRALHAQTVGLCEKRATLAGAPIPKTY